MCDTLIPVRVWEHSVESVHCQQGHMVLSVIPNTVFLKNAEHSKMFFPFSITELPPDHSLSNSPCCAPASEICVWSVGASPVARFLCEPPVKGSEIYYYAKVGEELEQHDCSLADEQKKKSENLNMHSGMFIFVSHGKQFNVNVVFFLKIRAKSGISVRM